MNRLINSALFKPFAVFILLLGLLANASAMDLREAKRMGFLGEQDNGYLGVVKANPEAKKIADTVNQKRKAKYQEIANKVGKPLSIVEKQAGEKLLTKTAPGQFIRQGGGSWKKK